MSATRPPLLVGRVLLAVEYLYLVEAELANFLAAMQCTKRQLTESSAAIRQMIRHRLATRLPTAACGAACLAIALLIIVLALLVQTAVQAISHDGTSATVPNCNLCV